MDKLIITAACDSSVSYPSNSYCPEPTRENTDLITREYIRCIDAGAAISHLHGVRKLESALQEDGRKLSKIDVEGWAEITQGLRSERETILQFGIAGARFEDRLPLLELGPDMMSVAFNAHDEHFQPDPEFPANTIYSLHPLDELRDYANELPSQGVKPEIEVFHSGAIWNLNKLHSEGLLSEPVWVTLFLDWEGGSWSPPTEEALLYMVGLLPEFANYNVSVMSPTAQWKLLSMVIGLGGHVRVGFEDNPYLSAGQLAETNAELVDKIVRIAHEQGRGIASPAEAREIIGLDGPPMRRVVVPEFLQEPFLTRIGANFEVVYDPDLYADRPRLLHEAAEAVAIIIRNRTRIDTEFLQSASAVSVVGRLGVGLDNIDMAACSTAGVTVIPAVGANAVSVAEYVMAAMLILRRGVFGMTESMIAGKWPRQGHAFGHELMGSTLGLIGYGSVARHVATRATALSMRIVAYDPYLNDGDPAWQGAEKVELDGLLAQADVVSLHTPLRDETRNLIDATAFEKMKPDAVLINTSRGGIVNEMALAAALRDGSIAGAALDVFASEPLGPEPAARFRGLENLILTPHVAGNTHESVDRVAEMITNAVLESLGPRSPMR